MNKAVILYILLLISFVVPAHQVKCQNPSKELGLKTVVIDPGHGGKDPGCLGKTRKTDEKHIALSIALGFGDRIKAAYPDVKVVYTRSTDVHLSLKERANIGKKNNPDLFVSIHCNSVPSSKAYGAAAYILGPKSNNPENKNDYFAMGQTVAQRENSVMLLEEDYKTSYQDFNPDSPESVISNRLLWMSNYENSLLFAAEYDAFIHKAPYRESRYTGIHQDVFYVLTLCITPAQLELGIDMIQSGQSGIDRERFGMGALTLQITGPAVFLLRVPADGQTLGRSSKGGIFQIIPALIVHMLPPVYAPSSAARFFQKASRCAVQVFPAPWTWVGPSRRCQMLKLPPCICSAWVNIARVESACWPMWWSW